MKHFLVGTFLFSIHSIFAQSCSDLNFQLRSEIGSTCSAMVMTMLHDRLDRPYVYVANKEAGLGVYDFSNPDIPIKTSEIGPSMLGNLDVMNLFQLNNYLFLSLGNTFSANQNAGMAIVDVSVPDSPVVSDLIIENNTLGGAGIVVASDNFAYLGAMTHGVFVYDISNKTDIQMLSKFVPAINFPDASPDPAKINARGMELRNDTLFLCYDAGGFRIIDASDKLNLTEIGRYANPALNGLPRAYNNVVLKDKLAYIAVDYCGLEILDFSNPAAITLKAWWNPYNCPGNNWFTSPVHANEIKMNENCGEVFLSTGKSDLMVLDVSDPAAPDSCNFYGGVSNNLGTWGVDIWKNHLFLSYVCAIIPFASNWTGVKCIDMNPCDLSLSEKVTAAYHFSLSPNPAETSFSLYSTSEISDIRLLTSNGTVVNTSFVRVSPTEYEMDVATLPGGIYFLHFGTEDKIYTQKIAVTP